MATNDKSANVSVSSDKDKEALETAPSASLVGVRASVHPDINERLENATKKGFDKGVLIEAGIRVWLKLSPAERAAAYDEVNKARVQAVMDFSSI